MSHPTSSRYSRPLVYDYFDAMRFRAIPHKRRYGKMVNDFIEFHNANPEIWELLVHFAWIAIKNGRRSLGISLVVEQIRWETTVITRSRTKFGLSNNHRAYYARLFNHFYGRLTGYQFFTTRIVTTPTPPILTTH